jgi:predicted acetyltransferase
MTVDIRTVGADGLRAWYDAVNTAFAEFTTDEQWSLDQRILESERTLGAFDGDRVVGGGGAFSFQLTVPGGRQVPAAGVTMVGVMPTHRRRGILRQLMARQLADARAGGDAVAILWASEGGIYQRFGYGLATLNARIDVEREHSAFRMPVEPRGSMALLPADEARPHLVEVYDAVRRSTPGFYDRSDTWWDVVLTDPEFRRRGASRRFNAVLTRDGRACGYVLYRVKEDWQPTGPANTLMVVEMLGIDPDAIQQLWRYVLSVDLMANVHARLGPADHPILLLAAEPRRFSVRVGDGVWLRVLDAAKALEARSYAADGTVVLEVADGFLPDAAGRWRLTVRDGTGRVEPTGDPADIELDVTDLGAVYLGAFRFASLAAAGRTTELTPGARERADQMFLASVAPWCPEIF